MFWMKGIVIVAIRQHTHYTQLEIHFIKIIVTVVEMLVAVVDGNGI